MAIEIYCDGIAKIRHKKSRIVYEIESDEVQWEAVSSAERGMGNDNLYLGKVEHEELDSLEWSFSEYPIGDVMGNQNYNFGDHILIENFDYGLKHVPDPEDYKEDFYGLSHFDTNFTEISVTDLQILPPEQQFEYLVRWFHTRFEDPVHEMPYNGREGGYLYIRGGPYDASDELSTNFGEVVDEMILEQAVEAIESDGTLDWAPKDDGSFHDDEIKFEPDIMTTFEEAATENKLNFGSDKELNARDQIVDQLHDILVSIENEIRPVEHGAIGHNKPPSDSVITNHLESLNPALQDMLIEIQSDKPNANVLLRVGKFIKSWLSSGIKIANESMFKTIGKIAAGSVLATVAVAAVSVNDKVATLYESLLNWFSLLV